MRGSVELALALSTLFGGEGMERGGRNNRGISFALMCV